MARRQTSFAIKAAVAAMGIALSGAAMSATVTVGTYDFMDYDPFGFPSYQLNAATDDSTGYQQLYSSSLFGSGIYNINSITFFVQQDDLLGFDGATYSVSFGYSPTTPAAFASNAVLESPTFTMFANKTVNRGTTGSDIGYELTFSSATPFTYNTANGNLLFDVNISNVTKSDGDIYFQATNLASTASILEAANVGACCSTTGGLVTAFNVTAVPEPETYAMMLAGLGALGFMARRRQFKG